MKKTLLALAVGVVVSASASASNMYLDLGTNAYDYTAGQHVADANSTTGIFNEFGFNQLLFAADFIQL